MDELETLLTCPLGSKCREVKDGKVHQCAWFIKMKGTDAQGEDHDEWNCAIAWQPILTTEVAGQVRGTQAAVESMRNIQDTRQQEAIQALRERSQAVLRGRSA